MVVFHVVQFVSQSIIGLKIVIIMFKAVIVKSLFRQEVQKCYVQNFLGETLNLAVLGSGCNKTVCGQEWLKCYIESLCDDDRRKIQEFNSETEFKFGDGKVVGSEKTVVIPCNIAGKNVSLKTDVVKSEIPLLLSKEVWRQQSRK